MSIILFYKATSINAHNINKNIVIPRVKNRLHELLQQDKEFTCEEREQINPTNALSINAALDFVKNPVRCCQHVHLLIQKLMDIVRIKKDDPKTKGSMHMLRVSNIYYVQVRNFVNFLFSKRCNTLSWRNVGINGTTMGKNRKGFLHQAKAI
jgi:hypothetical protein